MGSRKSFHFDKNHKTYYSYNEDTKATAWEDPPDKKISSSSRSPGSDDAEKMKPETSNFSSLFVGKFKPAKKKKKKKKSDADDNRLPIPHEKSGSSGAELARALAQTRSVSQTNSIGASSGAELARAFAKVTNGSKRIGQTDSSGAELARALAKARYSSKVMPPNELAAAAAKIKTKKSKRTKTARKEKFSARDFDYCMDDDGTIIWTE